MKIIYRVEIHAKPKEVFYWIEEPDRAKEWATSVTRSEFIKKTPNKIGTTFIEWVEEDGHEIEMKGTVTDFQPNKSFAVRVESESHSADVRFVLKEMNGMTRLTQEIELRFENELSDTISDSIRKSIISQAQNEFARLKELCEPHLS